jgi:hypothetical protein
MAGRKACLAIGVAQAGDLAYLGGAISGAEEVGRWARQSLFDAVEVLTDAPGNPPVTVDRVREKLLALLPDGAETDTFVLYFAGHGLRQQAEQHVWLLSDWNTALNSIAVDVLRKRLANFGIRHLAIFSDACRSMPNTAAIDSIDKLGVLPLGPADADPPKLDRFSAVQDGKEAFMVPGATPEEGRCIFTGALMEALWGHDAEAFADPDDTRITSESLGMYLLDRPKKIGERYRLSCEPESMPGLPRDHIVYFNKASPPDPIPAPVPWPEPPPPGSGDGTGPGGTDAERRFDEIVMDEAVLAKVLGANFGAANPLIDMGGGMPSIPRTAALALESLARVRSRAIDHLPDEQRRMVRWQRSVARIEVEKIVAETQQKTRERKITAAFEGIVLPYRYGTFLIVAGGDVKQIWAADGIEHDDSPPGQSRYVFSRDDPGYAAQILIEFTDGMFVPAMIMGALTTLVTREGDEVTGVLMVPSYQPNLQQTQKTLDTVAMLSAGTVSAASVDSLATELRMQKHANPMLGVIAAYLYDYVGDIDSIRRMAYFYLQHHQAIPFDIAFLAMIETWVGPAGQLNARVPLVPAREADPDGPPLPDWVTSGTEEKEGTVGGLCPWLRQGWDYLAAPEDVERPMTGALPLVQKQLLPSSFSALKEAGGRLLAGHWGLKAQLSGHRGLKARL